MCTDAPQFKLCHLAMKFYSFYSRLPHPHALRFRVRTFRMHGPQWNNTRIILTDARYPVIDAFYLVGTGANYEEGLDILPVDVVEGVWKGDCDLRSVVDEVYDTSARLPGSKVGEVLVYVGLE